MFEVFELLHDGTKEYWGVGATLTQAMVRAANHLLDECDELFAYDENPTNEEVFAAYTRTTGAVLHFGYCEPKVTDPIALYLQP